MRSADDVLLGQRITLKRAGAQWKGEIVAISDGPAVMLEQDGMRVLVSLDGATIDVGGESATLQLRSADEPA